MIISTDFPVNIWVASFMVYAFHGSTFLQSGAAGVYGCQFSFSTQADRGELSFSVYSGITKRNTTHFSSLNGIC